MCLHTHTRLLYAAEEEVSERPHQRSSPQIGRAHRSRRYTNSLVDRIHSTSTTDPPPHRCRQEDGTGHLGRSRPETQPCVDGVVGLRPTAIPRCRSLAEAPPRPRHQPRCIDKGPAPRTVSRSGVDKCCRRWRAAHADRHLGQEIVTVHST